MFAWLREMMATRAPSAKKTLAQAKPMPFEPPVTMTALPSSPRSIDGLREMVGRMGAFVLRRTSHFFFFEDIEMTLKSTIGCDEDFV
jgi:hypothetical protein